MSSCYKQGGGGWSWGEVKGLESDKVSGTEEDPVRYINSLPVNDGIAQFSRNLNPPASSFRTIEAFITEEVGNGTPEERKKRLMELVRSYYSHFQFKYKLARIRRGLSGARKKKKPKGSKKKGPSKKGHSKKGHSKKGSKGSKKGSKKGQGGGKSRKPKKAKQTRKRPKRSRSRRPKKMKHSKRAGAAGEGNNPYPSNVPKLCV